MKIAAAQISPDIGNVEANLEKHVLFIEKAVTRHADLIFFPELSLTGYEPRLADRLAADQADTRFDIIRELSDENRIIIGAGMPVRSEEGILISMLIFLPDTDPEIYSKQLLHRDELPFFTEGSHMVFLKHGEEKIAPAICYESLHPDFAEGAYKAGAGVYLASVAKSSAGLQEAMPFYASVAKKYAMVVCLSNSVGWCDNFLSAGQSSVWNSQGALLGGLGESGEGMLIFDTKSQEINILSAN